MYLPKGKASSAVEAAKAAGISVWGIKPNLFLAQEKIAKRINYFSASFAPSQMFFSEEKFCRRILSVRLRARRRTILPHYQLLGEELSNFSIQLLALFTRTSLSRDVSPQIISISPFETPKNPAKNFMSSALAFPSIAGAFIFIFTPSPYAPAAALFGALGTTLIFMCSGIFIKFLRLYAAENMRHVIKPYFD